MRLQDKQAVSCSKASWASPIHLLMFAILSTALGK